MCFILHIASTAKVPRKAWDENNRHLCIEDLHGVEENLRAHFSQPEIAYVGSSLGCGCGYRSVSFQNGDWPEEWMIEQGECEPPDDHIQDHEELHDLISSLIFRGHPVEIYGCWDGDESYQTAHKESISLDRLKDTSFWFRDRSLYQIFQSEQAAPSNR
jgi:hypothetical protein